MEGRGERWGIGRGGEREEGQEKGRKGRGKGWDTPGWNGLNKNCLWRTMFQWSHCPLQYRRQKLIYRKQNARQLRTQYVEGTYVNPVTLKSKLTVTQDHWKRNHWVDHTRLTMSRVIGRRILSWPWNVGQRSLKVIEISAFRKLGRCFLFAFYSNYGRICSRLWDIQCQTMEWPGNLVGVVHGHWKWRRSIGHMRLSIGRHSAIVHIALSCTIFEFFDVE